MGRSRVELVQYFTTPLRRDRYDLPEETCTVTYEHRPRKNLILKLERRYDRSDTDVFFDEENQRLLAIAGAVVTFQGENSMWDLIFVALTVVLIALSAAYVRACEKL